MRTLRLSPELIWEVASWHSWRPFSLNRISNFSSVPQYPPLPRPPGALCEGCHHCGEEKSPTGPGLGADQRQGADPYLCGGLLLQQPCPALPVCHTPPQALTPLPRCSEVLLGHVLYPCCTDLQSYICSLKKEGSDGGPPRIHARIAHASHGVQ